MAAYDPSTLARKGASLAAAVPMLGGVLGCDYYDSSLLTRSPSSDASWDSATADSPVDARSDATDGGVDDANQCASAWPPTPPSIQDAGGSQELVLALHTLDFHEGSDYKAIGFDIDRSCTCEGGPSTCKAPVDAPADSWCDGPDGRDNAAGGLIAAATMLGLSSTSLNQGIAEGEWSVLFRVQGYNGLPDDDEVSVAWLVPENLMKVPSWDGSDTWAIKGTCLGRDGNGNLDLSNPLVVDKSAYVREGRLVASLRGGARLEVSSTFTFVAGDAYLVAKLQPSGSTWLVQDGVLAGIWKSNDILAALSGTKVANVPVCTDNPVYPAIKETICKYRDILGGVGLPSVPCDSLSLAFTFTASPARIGVALDTPPPANPCTAQNDPASDSCD